MLGMLSCTEVLHQASKGWPASTWKNAQLSQLQPKGTILLVLPLCTVVSVLLYRHNQSTCIRIDSDTIDCPDSIFRYDAVSDFRCDIDQIMF